MSFQEVKFRKLHRLLMIIFRRITRISMKILWLQNDQKNVISQKLFKNLDFALNFDHFSNFCIHRDGANIHRSITYCMLQSANRMHGAQFSRKFKLGK